MPQGVVDEMPFVPAYKVRGGTTIYVSGATAFPLYHSHPHREEELRVPGSIREQTRRALENIRLVLTASGATLKDVVKVTIFNTRMDLQDEMNEIYREIFGDHKPARSHIGAATLVGKGLMIEIEAVAVIDD